MSGTEGLDAVAHGANDLRPLVARAVSRRGAWFFTGIMGVCAVVLFAALEARRAEVSSPAVEADPLAQGVQIASPPDLAIPPDYAASAPIAPAVLPVQPAQTATPRPVPFAIPPRQYTPSPPGRVPGPGSVAPAATQTEPGPAYAYQAASRPAPGPAVASESSGTDRAYAVPFANPARTVPQGTVIQVVLETAFDSSRPGFARAVVSRDVTSFDGSRVLIPKGSKLVGEYKADVGYGQNRALIQWHRLIRPDGMTIDVDSPSADPLGRAGIKGSVNSHFLARFGGAILQSALDIGVQIAARSATGGTVVLLPGATEGLTARRPEDVKPTVTVKQGTSVSVFVMRDLDFSPVDP